MAATLKRPFVLRIGEEENPNIFYWPIANMRFPHEFDVDPKITEHGIAEKYSRRVNRFLSLGRSDDRVLFVRTRNAGYQNIGEETYEHFTSELLGI